MSRKPAFPESAFLCAPPLSGPLKAWPPGLAPHPAPIPIPRALRGLPNAARGQWSPPRPRFPPEQLMGACWGHLWAVSRLKLPDSFQLEQEACLWSSYWALS